MTEKVNTDMKEIEKEKILKNCNKGSKYLEEEK